MFRKEKLIEFMRQNNVSAAQLARDLEVSPGMIRNITYGLKQPSLAMTAQFARMIGCTVDELVLTENI